MSRNHLWVGAGASLLLLITAATSYAGDDSGMIKPGTPQATQATTELDAAAKMDRLNAHSYYGGEDGEAAIFYFGKAKEAESLASQLRGNHSVLSSDIQRALDNSKAIRYTGGY